MVYSFGVEGLDCRAQASVASIESVVVGREHHVKSGCDECIHVFVRSVEAGISRIFWAGHGVSRLTTA